MTELERLINRENITIDAVPSKAKPLSPTMLGFAPWDVTLKSHGKRFTTQFFASHGYEPVTADVIWSVCRETAIIDETSGFETWCKKTGYSTDSRMAHALWEGMARSAPKLKRFLGRKYKDFVNAKHY